MVTPSGAGLVERERELGILEAALGAARSGRGSMTVVEGPAGAGKSALVRASGARAAAAATQVLDAAGRARELDFPFGVALQLFEGRLAGAAPDEQASLLSGPAHLARPLFDGARGDRLPDGPAFTLLHGLYWLVANLAERGPLVLCVDDAQLADEASLRFLLYLAARIERHPVAVVLGADLAAVAADQGSALGELLAHREATVVRLAPLTRQSVSDHVRRSAFPDAADAFCDACHQATAGNPGLLELLLGELSDPDVDPSAASAGEVQRIAPVRVAADAVTRLLAIDAGAPELARAVSTLGADAQLRHAAALAGLAPADAVRLAGALVAAGVLRGGTSLSFVHPIVGRALEERRPPAERAVAHGRAARLLQEDGGPVEQVADHLLRAPRTASAWVVDVLAAAGERALERGAPVAACTYLRRALTEPPAAERRSALTAALGHAEGLAASPGALERLREGLELLPDARDRAGVALAIGRILSTQGRHRTAAATFLEALSAVDGDPEAPRAELWVSYAAAARIGMTFEADTPWNGGVPAWLSEHEADGTTGRLLLAQRAFELALAGEPRTQVRELAQRALAGGLLVAEQGCDGVGPYLAGVALGLADELQSAQAVGAALADDARARGSKPGLVQAVTLAGWALMHRGHLGAAELEVGRALEPGDPARARPTALQAVRAALALEAEEPQTAAGLVDGWERSADPTSGLEYIVRLGLRGRLCLAQGRAEQALEDFTDCGRRATAAGILNPAAVGWRTGSAVALLHLGRLDEARVLAEEELALARAFGTPRAISAPLRVLGQIEGGEAGLERLREAADVLAGSQAELERGRALVDLGAALRRAGKRREARGPLRESLELARGCAMDALAERASAELKACGGRPRRRMESGAAALTPREQQVAVEAAQGLSNREIADALVITVKTVEWHLSQAYRKLEVSSRQELAAALAGSRATMSGR